MTAEAAQVLAAMRAVPHVCFRPAMLARWLNLDAPCGWCSVGLPRRGERCATVPKASRARAERALKELVAAGLVRHLYPRTRMTMYVLADSPVAVEADKWHR